MSDEHSRMKKFLSDLWKKVFRKSQLPDDEDWKLDEKFIKDMEAWKERHPDSTLMKVMERVSDAVKKNLPFAELVPDSPFPARGLVKSLAHLLLLGVRVARAKEDVFEFTWEVIAWLSTVETAFGNRQERELISIARTNLKHIRSLINEICKWGWARLNDGRWTGLIKGLAITDEIRVFKERLTAAKELLNSLQVGTLVVGVDEILDLIRNIKELQKSQLSTIIDHLEEAKAAEERERFLQRTLFEVALSKTAYDNQGKFPCDEDTRVEILADIKRWVNDVSAESQNFFWLTGDPGCGKSAITASLARYCKDAGTLWAQFFINRNNEATTNPRVYFPSIARQMADHHTSEQTISKIIYEIIKRKPSVLDQMALDQALGLFVKTVQAACDLDPSKPVTIVIDGLDETQRDKLQDTAYIFSKLFEVLERRNAKVFISCRTDDQITKPFYHALRCNERHVKHVHLNTSDSSSVEDVSLYLSRNVAQIVEELNLNWKQWPGEERLETLCVRASGLFIWAVTVVKFFQEQLRQSEHERLNELLDVINEEGMDDVNRLYGKILEITYTVKTNTKTQNDWEHEKFRWIVGFIIGLKEPLSVGDIGALLDLRQTPTTNVVNVVRFVTNLRTVLISGTGIISDETIPRPHKSFVEFITSERADPQFRIDAALVDGQIATKCLRLVNRLKCAKERELLPAGGVRYAIDNWTRHLPTEGTSKSGVGIVGDAVGLWKVLSATAPLGEGFMTASGDYRTHMYDPVTGVPPPLFHHSSTIQGLNGIWAVAVSPDGRLIASGNCNGVVQVWNRLSHELIWKSTKHGDLVRSVCFSPDSSWLVSGSDDKSARIWDCRTGEAIGSPLLGQSDSINSVCTDGRRIISGCEDGTIYIWSCATRELIGAPIKVGKCVYTVALSNGGRIATGVGNDVCIFDIESRRQMASMKGHIGLVLTVAFSPDGSQIASGGGDNTIRIWDVQTRKQRYRFDGHTDFVRTVSFSPDAFWIVSGSDDNTVRVWSTKTGQSADPPLTRHTSYVRGVAFSPDGLQLVSGSPDCAVQIWELRKREKTSQQITAIHLSQHPGHSPDNIISLEGHPSIISASYSPNGSFYTTSTLDGRVSIWNMDRELIWETNTSIYPIHLLRLSETQLLLCAPDGSTSSWNLLDGIPTHEEAICRRPRVNTNDLLQSASLSNDMVSWFPYDTGAGLWAFVDESVISFDTENSSVTIVDVSEYLG